MCLARYLPHADAGSRYGQASHCRGFYRAGTDLSEHCNQAGCRGRLPAGHPHPASGHFQPARLSRLGTFSVFSASLLRSVLVLKSGRSGSIGPYLRAHPGCRPGLDYGLIAPTLRARGRPTQLLPGRCDSQKAIRRKDSPNTLVLYAACSNVFVLVLGLGLRWLIRTLSN